MANSTLRSEIQALRNQAKAQNNHLHTVQQKMYTDIVSHAFVAHDLIFTGIFLIVILVLLLIASVFLSTFPLFQNIRDMYHISLVSF